jgi:hypothetical protein
LTLILTETIKHRRVDTIGEQKEILLRGKPVPIDPEPEPHFLLLRFSREAGMYAANTSSFVSSGFEFWDICNEIHIVQHSDAFFQSASQ